MNHHPIGTLELRNAVNNLNRQQRMGRAVVRKRHVFVANVISRYNRMPPEASCSIQMGVLRAATRARLELVL